MRRECGACPPLAVQAGRCRLAVEVFTRAMRWFTPDVFTGYRQAQEQLAKVRRWQVEVNRHIRSLRLSRASELAVARALKFIDARNNMRGLSPEAASFRKVALLWCGLTLLEDARNTCPLLARSGPWRWLIQSADKFATALVNVLPGADEEGTRFYQEIVG